MHEGLELLIFLFFMLKYFSYFYVYSSSFCFTTKVKLYFLKLLKRANLLYDNEILLHGSRARPIDATRPGGHVRMDYVARLSRATSPGATGPGLTVLCRYVARAVAPISVAQLGLDLLSQADLWCDWESRHRV
jgi:hypothetical protein